MEDMKDYLTRCLDDWKVPGMAVAAIRDGEILFSEGFGFRDPDTGLEVTPDTIFAIGSCTKAFTCAALGILSDEGKLDWNRPVSEFLPEFKLVDPYISDHITPIDLVTHRSGLPRHDFLWYGSRFSRWEMLERLRYLEMSKGLRESYQYNNLMYLAAGCLIEKLSGRTWEEFVRERLLDPLGMTRTNLSVEDSPKSDDFAAPFMKKEDQAFRVPFKNIDSIAPAGAINSSVAEMTRWLALNLNGGKIGDRELISEKELNRIHSPVVVVPSELSDDERGYPSYAMGWQIQTYRGELTVSHGGGIDGFSSYVLSLPRQNAGIVALTNLSGTPLPYMTALHLADRLLEKEPIDWSERIKREAEKSEASRKEAEEKRKSSRKEGTKPAHALVDYAGAYEHPAYGVVSLSVEGDQLKGNLNETLFYRLEHFHYEVFEAVDERWDQRMKMRFADDMDGIPAQLSVKLEESVSEIVFKRKPEN